MYNYNITMVANVYNVPYIGFLIIPKLTNSYFSEGWPNHQPDKEISSNGGIQNGWFIMEMSTKMDDD